MIDVVPGWNASTTGTVVHDVVLAGFWNDDVDVVDKVVNECLLLLNGRTPTTSNTNNTAMLQHATAEANDDDCDADDTRSSGDKP